MPTNCSSVAMTALRRVRRPARSSSVGRQRSRSARFGSSSLPSARADTAPYAARMSAKSASPRCSRCRSRPSCSATPSGVPAPSASTTKASSVAPAATTGRRTYLSKDATTGASSSVRSMPVRHTPTASPGARALSVVVTSSRSTAARLTIVLSLCTVGFLTKCLTELCSSPGRARAARRPPSGARAPRRVL